MPGTSYPGAVGRSLTDVLGDRLSVLSYGAVGDGVTDDTAAINTAIQRLSALGGRDLYFPGGRTYAVSHLVFPSGSLKLRLSGDGAATVFKKIGAASSTGIFDIQGSSGLTFRNFSCDWGKTTATKLTYSVVGGDPMNSLLTSNSGFWLHGGSKNIVFDHVNFTHTYGYNILLDATSSDVEDVSVLGCFFSNNRPHLFGVTVGSENYGSWTGGIHYQGGANSAVNGLLVRDCAFRRNTGHCVWGHSYAADPANILTFHRNIIVSSNQFEDFGLDGVLFGCVSGGSIDGNTFRRGGYITETDSDTPVPRWINGGYAYSCAIDTAGLVKGTNYKGNTIISQNGGSMDLDGFSDGVVSGNTCICPSSSDPEFSEDDIAHTGINSNGVGTSYGLQIGNTNNSPTGGQNVTVTGNTFVNMSIGALRLYGARNCSITGNTIDHAANSVYCPVTIGNMGSGSYQRSYENVVTGNKVTWSPAYYSPVVVEDASAFVFQSTDRNWVSGNNITGANVYEFGKADSSGSGTRVVFSSAQGSVGGQSESHMQREGGATSGYLRIYKKNNGVGASVSTLLDAGPHLNVSTDGAASTGVVSTANRTSSSLLDAVVSGKGLFDAFLSLRASTFLAAEADSLDSTYSLIRRKSAADPTIEVSTSVSGGHRVWTSLGTGSGGVASGLALSNNVSATAAKTDTTVCPIITMGSDNNLYIDNATGPVGNMLLRVPTNQYIILGPVSGGGAVVPTRNASVDLGSVESGYQWRNALLSGRLGIGNTSPQAPLHIGPTASVPFGQSPAIFASSSASRNIVTIQYSGNVAVGVAHDYFQYSARGSEVSPSALQANDAMGGLRSGGYGSTTWSTRRANIIFYAAENWSDTAQGTYITFETCGVGTVGSPERLRIAPNGTLNINCSDSLATLNLRAIGGVDSILVKNGAGTTTLFRVDEVGNTFTGPVQIMSDSGNAIQAYPGKTPGATLATFSATSTAANAVQVTGNNGGFSGYSHTFLTGSPGVSASGEAKIKYDGSKLMVSYNGGAYSALVASAGVASIGAYTYPALTGAVTISPSDGYILITQIGQDIRIGLNSSPTFAYVGTASISVTSSYGTAVNVPDGGVTAKFLSATGGTNFNSIQSVTGGVSSNTGYYLSSGTQVIDNLGRFVGNGVLCINSGVSCAGVNPYVGGLQWYGVSDSDLYFASGFTIGSTTYHTIRVRGGVIVQFL